MIHVPSIEEVRDLFTELVSNTGVVVEIDKHDPAADSIVARYLDRKDQLAAVVTADLVTAAALGAALAMVPATVAEEAAKDGEFTGIIREAYAEVANIAARLMCVNGVSHVRFIDVSDPLDAAPEDARAVLASPAGTLHAKVQIDDVGEGVFSVFTAGA